MVNDSLVRRVRFVDTLDGAARYLKFHEISEGEKSSAVRMGWADCIILEKVDIQFLMGDDDAERITGKTTTKRHSHSSNDPR